MLIDPEVNSSVTHVLFSLLLLLFPPSDICMQLLVSGSALRGA